MGIKELFSLHCSDFKDFISIKFDMELRQFFLSIVLKMKHCI